MSHQRRGAASRIVTNREPGDYAGILGQRALTGDPPTPEPPPKLALVKPPAPKPCCPTCGQTIKEPAKRCTSVTWIGNTEITCSGFRARNRDLCNIHGKMLAKHAKTGAAK